MKAPHSWATRLRAQGNMLDEHSVTLKSMLAEACKPSLRKKIAAPQLHVPGDVACRVAGQVLRAAWRVLRADYRHVQQSAEHVLSMC